MYNRQNMVIDLKDITVKRLFVIFLFVMAVGGAFSGYNLMTWSAPSNSPQELIFFAQCLGIVGGAALGFYAAGWIVKLLIDIRIDNHY
jgi:hypothetical protein